ncbi:MAG: hypothetical protein CSA97_03535 [Bacteroidetes bacterium]|nr:MAG: hypothetical protein CSA97_03535 [Bacteroidota bacterium]
MGSSLSLGYLAVGLSLLFSALFSGMEIAYLSANRLRLEMDRKSNSLNNRLVKMYVSHPSQFIATILVGNNIAVVVYGMAMTVVLAPWLNGISQNASFLLATQTVISTIIVLIIAEFLPKVLFHTHPNFFLKVFAFPISVFYILLFPVAHATTWLSNRLLRMFIPGGVDSQASALAFGKSDLNNLVDEASQGKAKEEEDQVKEQEIRIFQNALDFSEVKVRDCLIPRPDMVTIEINESLQRLQQLFVSSHYSRIPVYEDTVDNIVGYVNAKSLFHSPERIADVLMQLPYVPETMRARDLLTQFIRTSRSMAIVVDEFGGTAGLVTIEDLVEEIFGEINDEHDLTRIVMKEVDEGMYLLSGRAEVEAINEQFGLEIPEEEGYDTLAGFILEHDPSIPKVGEEIVIGCFLITVLRANAGRIGLVQLRVLDR